MAKYRFTYDQTYQIDKESAPNVDEIIRYASDVGKVSPEMDEPETGECIESNCSNIVIEDVEYDENGFDGYGKLQRSLAFTIEVDGGLIDDDPEYWFNIRLTDYSTIGDWAEFYEETYDCEDV